MSSVALAGVVSHYDAENVLLMKIFFHYLYGKRGLSKRCEFLHFDVLCKNILSIDPELSYLAKKMTVFLRDSLTHLNFEGSSNDLQVSLNRVFFLMLDAYFEYLQPFTIKLLLPSSEVLFMPRINCSISLVGAALLVEKKASQDLWVNGQRLASFGRRVLLLDNINFLVASKPEYDALFCNVDSTYLLPLSSDPPKSCDYRKLQRSLLAIALGYPEVYQDLQTLVEFIVPMKNLDKHSASFTLRPYPGVIFLSCNTDELAIAENILREFYKSKMNLYLELEHLLVDDSVRYFTPYAKNPSSPTELLTNAVVFIEVCQFFTHCLLHDAFKKSVSLLQYRLTVQLYRMELALGQMDAVDWLPSGKKLLDFVRHRYKALRLANKEKLLPRPAVIDDQLKAWAENYPNMALPCLMDSLTELSG